MRTTSFLLLIMAVSAMTTSCAKTLLNDTAEIRNSPLLTKAVTPEEFDWETADWMPTPAGQSRISVPWIGQGSLTAFYGLDIVNDYKKTDGWKLLYSTFTSSGSADLVNPYFILYNVYRGTMRVYLYVTTSFIAPSSYLQDCLSVVSSSGVETTMLNYLGRNVIATSDRVKNYAQIQPRPLDGSAPLAANRWYMIEYELAYDPNIEKVRGDQIQLKWQLNYLNVPTFRVDGGMDTSINGTIGKASTSVNNVFSTISRGVTIAEKASFAMFGLDYLNSVKTDEQGANTIGLSSSIFKALLSGATSAVASISAGFPEFAFELLNAVFGGKKGSSETPVTLKAESEIYLVGESRESGSFPSMPISWWVPGTNMPSTIQGYVPLYKDPLGVFYWDGPDYVDYFITHTIRYEEDDIMFTGKYRVCETSVAVRPQYYIDGLKINPAVLEVADVTVVSDDYIALDEDGHVYEYNPEHLHATDNSNPYETSSVLPNLSYVLKYVIKVQPKDGTPASYICKTFRLKKRIASERTYYVEN